MGNEAFGVFVLQEVIVRAMSRLYVEAPPRSALMRVSAAIPARPSRRQLLGSLGLLNDMQYCVFAPNVSFGSNASVELSWHVGFTPSRPGEFHPEPLTEPDLILSHHPARAT